MNLLDVKNLTVSVGEKTVLDKLILQLIEGKYILYLVQMGVVSLRFL